MKFLTVLFLLLAFAPNVSAQNYDEQRVPAYTLPPLLTTAGGKAVQNRSAWEHTRRPELLKLFEDHVYGQVPHSFDSIQYLPVNTNLQAMGGKAVLQQTDIRVFRQGNAVTIHLVMFVPVRAAKPVPLFLLINNRGASNTDPSRKIKSEFWPAEQVIDSGYAIAAFHISDVAPDNKNTWMNGVLKLYPEQLDAGNGMRAISAWAWGASRVMDYLQTYRPVNARQVAVVGHSRGGKAALWTSAQDPRFAMCCASCSGNTGAALARRRFGETIEKINATFPYWFCNNYKKYNSSEDSLPVDQHMLIALSAPRFIYTTNATEDLWADPKGSFLALKNAEPAFALYGRASKLPELPPPADQPLIQSTLGYHLRTGIHNLTAYDWTQFIKFANYHFRKPHEH